MQHNHNFRINHRGQAFLDKLFSAQAVRKRALVRRSVISVERECGRELLLEEVKRRRFHMIESGGQFLILCHSGRIRTYC